MKRARQNNFDIIYPEFYGSASSPVKSGQAI